MSWLDELLAEVIREEKGEPEPWLPTDYALGQLRWLEDAILPHPTYMLSTAFDGQLRLTWRRGPRELRLVLAPSDAYKSYVYWQDERSDAYGLEEISNPEYLSDWLEWLEDVR